MQHWVLESEALLAGAALLPEAQTRETIGTQFDEWCEGVMAQSQEPMVLVAEQQVIACQLSPDNAPGSLRMRNWRLPQRSHATADKAACQHLRPRL